MLSTAQKDNIIYQAQNWIATTGYSLIEQEQYSRPCDCEYYKIYKTIQYLNVIQDPNVDIYLTDVEQEYIYKCLVSSLLLNNLPVGGTPFTFQTPPSILYGLPGNTGAKGDSGAQGPAGLATDFAAINISSTTVVDSFTISSAKAARWDYLVVNTSNDQRAGVLLGQWSNDGLLFTSADNSTDDLVGSTSGISLNVTVTGSTVQMSAVITSGTWNIYGSRYFIPNNGSGTGPISDVLTHNYIYIGNISNQATGVAVSGAVSITDTGIVSINNDYITNSQINSSAAISLTKLAALSTSKLVVTDVSGIITTTNTPSLTTLGYLDATSSIQTQLNSKLLDPTSNIGDIIIRNASNVIARLPIGTTGQVLSISGGVPIWSTLAGSISGLTTNYLPKASSSTSINDSVISQSGSTITITGNTVTTSTAEFQGGFRTAASGAYLLKKILSIGSWNMYGVAFGTSTKTVAHGLSDTRKIRTLSVTIVSDSNVSSSLFTGLSVTDGSQQGYERRDNTNITLTRINGGFFDSSNYISNSTRGYITIEYEP